MTAAIALLMAAQLTGTVRDAVTKLPVDGVKVEITAARGRSTTSNANGAFVLDGIETGKYRVQFSRQGYDTESTTVEAKDDADPVIFDMKPRAQVSGQILDEDGKPLEGVLVYIGGLRDTTGKDGRYHATEITGGSYTLMFRLPYELRRETAVHDEKRGETFGYANTLYYPGIADGSLAAPMTIAPGARLMNLDVRLRRERLVEIRGRVVDANPETAVELDSGNGRPDETFGRRKLDAKGGFHFDLLTPREYTLVVYRNRTGDDLPYLTTVAVGEAGRQDVEVVQPEFVTIEGVVRTVRDDLHWEGTLRVRLGRLDHNLEDRVGPEGRFTFDAVPPGEWNLTTEPNLVHPVGDPKGKLYVAPRPGKLRVTESGNAPLEIVLSDVVGHITGTSEGRTPVWAMRVGGGSGELHMGLTGQDGRFTLDLPPGEYRIAPACSLIDRQQAATVVVREGQNTAVHVKGCPEPEK